MWKQPFLPGLEPAPPLPQTNGIFLAIVPEENAASDIAQLTQRRRVEHGLTGAPLEENRLHLSLLGFGRFPSMPQKLIDVVSKAMTSVSVSPFEVKFDRMMSFSGKAGNRPLVLRGDYDGLAALTDFQHDLVMLMSKFGLARLIKQHFTPHITLLYDRRGVDEEPIETIRWTVREFLLIHSLIGKHKHIPLARWSLRG